MEGMAAMLSQLDLIISVPNSAVHLAAAVGSPVWLLHPLVADWRWMADRADSPWHRSVQVFRQNSRREWTDVFALIRAELIELVQQRRDAA